MKRTTAIALFVFGSILTAGTALAQNRAVKATVPFDFTVGSALLPADTYIITPVSDNLIEIRNRDKHIAVLSLAMTDFNGSGDGGKLVFNRYAGQYFLREILCDSASMHLSLPETKPEKRARMQEARLSGSAGQTLVAAK